MTQISRRSPSGKRSQTIISVEADVGALAVGPNTVTLSVPGARPGDAVVVNPSPLLSDLLFIVQTHAAASAGQISMVIFNFDGAPVSPGPLPWLVTLFR